MGNKFDVLVAAILCKVAADMTLPVCIDYMSIASVYLGDSSRHDMAAHIFR